MEDRRCLLTSRHASSALSRCMVKNDRALGAEDAPGSAERGASGFEDESDSEMYNGEGGAGDPPTDKPDVTRCRPGEVWSYDMCRARSVDLLASISAQDREQYIDDRKGVSVAGADAGVLRMTVSGDPEGLPAVQTAGAGAAGSAVFERVRGWCLLVVVLLAAATAARRLAELGPRRSGGRVIFCPFAVRVVTVPSGFLT